MDTTQEFRRLLRGSLLAVLVCAVLVVLCYYLLDRPIAFYVHDHGLSRFAVLKWLTLPPPIAQTWAPVLLAAVVVRRAWGPLARWELALLSAGAAIILADQFRETLSAACGRYWPETWIDNNPSLIRDGAYGFHPLEEVGNRGSFPSGHAARTSAAAAVVWVVYPRWRAAAVVVALAVAVGLLGMNYHFLGDVVAGSFLGAVVGVYTTHFCRRGLTEGAGRA